MTSYTYRMESLLNSVISKYLNAFQAAESLEIALVNQKGFVSYYFIDGDPDWLRQLGEYRQIFKERLAKATLNIETEKEQEVLSLLKKEYESYIALKDQVIELYRVGERETGSKLHAKTRGHFFEILNLCQKYKEIYTEKIMKARSESHDQAKRLRIVALTGMAMGFSLALWLLFVLARQILDPVKRLTEEADRRHSATDGGDEIKALSISIHNLIKDVDDSHLELEKSQKHLVEAEKMALVGKLAAGMAHSIRNPFTSVKMRLFSLNRSLELNNAQDEDFKVISEEIRHIDTIVQNFLEFSRPPRLNMQKISPSMVVDSTVQLLAHRLKSYKVAITLNRPKMLPEIQIDPDQLKEVFVNLVINACEAMENGGSIIISESEGTNENGKSTVIIKITDDGPGVPQVLHDKILEPFFTTKEEGTGLGLSIVKRIIEEHNGRLDLISEEGVGTTFIITLAIKENGFENNSDH